MYTFIDQDGQQVEIKPEQGQEALKLANDFRKWTFPNDKHNSFHKSRRMYWEDFYTQLNKLMNL